MNQQQREREQGIDPIDFPCSYSWRAYYAETQEGVYLPSIEPPRPVRPEPQNVIMTAPIRSPLRHIKHRLLVNKRKPYRIKE